MGHSTAMRYVTAKQLEELVADKPSFTRNGWVLNSSTTDRIFSIALSDWHNEEADRHDNARTTSPRMLKVRPEELLHNIEDVDSVVIPLMDKSDYSVEKKFVNLKLDGDEWREVYNDYDKLLQKLSQGYPELENSITSFRIVLPEVLTPTHSSNGWKLSSTIDADTSGGKAKTVYYLVVNGYPRKDVEYTSQALARAAGMEQLKKDMNVLEVNVEAFVKREEVNSLVRMKRVVRSASARFEVNYVKIKSKTPTSNGWMVYFDYHH